ncbi:MAG: HAD family phosphatase [Chlamydiae bacterium]|nr:HAD family phosphatase [Chlamydiota bacterium]
MNIRFFMRHPGWICLDIDGTITADPFSIPDTVVKYFTSLYTLGWRFCFITGRTLSFACKVLDKITFPFYISVQNGADILQMPEKKLIRQSYLSSDVLAHLDVIYKDLPEDYIVYSGWERGDYCYYRPSRSSAQMNTYFSFLMTLSGTPWVALDDFSSLARETFSLIKCLGSLQMMKYVETKLKEIDGIHVTMIKDPTSPCEGYIILITDKSASKGNAMAFLKSSEKNAHLYIAAGDDMNDISLLKEADIAIAMGDAPESLQKIAHIIAKPATELGIIDALNTAIHNRNK